MITRRDLLLISPLVFLGYNSSKSCVFKNINIKIVSSYNDMKSLKPIHEGEFLYLSSWHKSNHNHYGSGLFVSQLDIGSHEDGGVVCRYSHNIIWKRIYNMNSLSVLDFGAIPDGDFDCSESILNMYRWSLSVNNLYFISSPRVYFPYGTYYVSGVDFTKFESEVNHLVIQGPNVNFGYSAQVNIISDFKEGFIFKCGVRQLEVSNIGVDGRNNIYENKKSFIENTHIDGGTFNRFSSIWIRNFGGLCIALKDTLDTKVSQFYANDCRGGVIRISYDNFEKGNWNHSTAFELSNFNFQSCYPEKAIRATRCFQSILNNGWFEKSNCGDFTNGHWNVSSLSVENCNKYGALDFTNSRLVEIQTNQLASEIIRDYNPKTAFVSSFQPGQLSIASHLISSNSEARFGWECVNDFIKNTNNFDIEFEIGTLWLNEYLDQFYIEIYGFSFNDMERNFDLKPSYLFFYKDVDLIIKCKVVLSEFSSLKDIKVHSSKNSSARISAVLRKNSSVGFKKIAICERIGSEQSINWISSLSFK